MVNDRDMGPGGAGDMAKGSTGNGANDLGTHPSPSPTPNPSPSPNPNPGACGTCPTGYMCGSANGVAACRAPSGIPQFSHVFVIVMENTSQKSLKAATTATYVQSLYMNAASGNDYHGVTHPSLPNYLALTSGSAGVQMDGTTPVSCDCNPVGATCNMCSTFSTFLQNCGCEQNTQHIGDQLDVAHKSWKAYGEDMGTACNKTSAGNYAVKHVPFLYYDNVQLDTGTRCADHVVDFASVFPGDLSGATPAFSFISPNLINDMHGTGLTQGASDIAAGDAWLNTNVTAIVASSAYQHGGVLFIVWDEDDLSGVLAKDDAVPMFVLSPLAKTAYQSDTHADHYSLLATIEDGLGLPRMGGAAGATPLVDFFPPN